MELLTVFSLCLVFNLGSAYKILLIFPNPSKSHGILGEGYVRHLIKAGHEVTYIAAVPVKNASKNLRQIDVSSNFKYVNALLEDLNFTDLSDKNVHWELMWKGLDAFYAVLSNTIENEQVQKLLYDDNENFDAVIVEWFYNEIHSGFAAVFNCPLIWSSSIEPHAAVLSLIDEAPNPAYVPDHLSSLVPPFSFLERVKSLIEVKMVEILKWYIAEALDETLYEANFAKAIRKRGRIPPAFQEVRYNASFMLGNSHASTGLSISLPQNYKGISGYHIKEELEPLSEKFQKIMNSSKHGVIYFSLGSVASSSKLSDEIKQGLVKVFASLKQTVIWKLEERTSDIPKNIHVVDWAPQQSILAHPNCVLFITHGGYLSTIETIHYGKPIIGIPVFADQFNNVKRAVSKGYALEVLMARDLPEKLRIAIEEILLNPEYSRRAKELSFVHHNRLVKPGEELVHWVEHVIQTKGAPELRSPAFHVSWYQKQYLDLIAIVLFLIYFTVKVIKILCCSRRNINKNEIIKKNN